MVNLLRRREMILPSGSSERDVEWDYTMGLPTVNGVFTKETNGTVTETLEANDVKLTAKTNGSYVRYVYPTSPKYEKGVMEVSIKNGGTSNYYWIISISTDGTKGFGVRCQNSTNYKGIYLCDASALADMTKIGSFSNNTNYTITLVWDNGYGDVYVDGNLVYSHFPLSSEFMYNMNRVQFTASSSYTYTGYLYSIKLKLGRTS